MTYVAEKLDELRAESARLAARALAITNQPEITPKDRENFEELLQLLFEIDDYAARLQTPGEKWKEKTMPNPHKKIYPNGKPKPAPVQKKLA